MQIEKQMKFVSKEQYHECSYVISLLTLDSVVHRFIVTFSLFMCFYAVVFFCVLRQRYE